MRLEKHDCAGEDMCTLPREPADFETVHVKELQFLQMSSSKADIYTIPSALLHALITVTAVQLI